MSTPKQTYSLICFSKYIDDNERNDRVIADTWDTAYALHIGKISIDDIERLKKIFLFKKLEEILPKN